MKILVSEHQKIFTDIFNRYGWGKVESRSGRGSGLDQTKTIREILPTLLKKLDCKVLLDLPCGDCNWISQVDLDCEYIGADIVEKLITENRVKYPSWIFHVIDITKDPLPSADVLLCRDCLVHFSTEDIFAVLNMVKTSRLKYLLTTTFPEHKNTNISTGGWHPVNLSEQPFNLPTPVLVVNEHCPVTEYSDKSLALWSVAEPGSKNE